MNDFFEFIEKIILFANNFAIKAKGPKQQNMAWKHGKIWHKIFFLMNVKLSSNLSSNSKEKIKI